MTNKIKQQKQQQTDQNTQEVLHSITRYDTCTGTPNEKKEQGQKS